MKNSMATGSFPIELIVSFRWRDEDFTARKTCALRQAARIDVPCDSTGLKAEVRAVMGASILTRPFPTPADACFEVRGTTAKPEWAACTPARDCSGDRHFEFQGLMRGFKARLQLTYTLHGGRPFSVDVELERERTKTVTIPCNASAVRVIASTDRGAVFFDRTYPAADYGTVCLEVDGKRKSPTCLPCCERTIVIFNNRGLKANMHYGYTLYLPGVLNWRSVDHEFPVFKGRNTIEIPCSAHRVGFRLTKEDGVKIFSNWYSKAVNDCFELRGTQAAPKCVPCSSK